MRVLDHRHVRPMAYDWNTMPSPRRFGGTKMPRCEEYTDFAADRDFSLPAPLQAGDGAQRWWSCAAARREA